MSEAKLTLNDLPRFSPWPERLLGLKPWAQRQKTAQEITREYEHETYGPLLEKVRAAGRPLSVEDVDNLWLPDSGDWLCVDHGEFCAMPPREYRRKYLDVVGASLERWLPAAALVELGCGYGSVLLRMAHRPALRRLPLIGGEYTASGVELARLLADWEGTPLTVSRCDIATPEITDLNIPRGALFFTSFATPYVPILSGAFVNWFCQQKARAVVHVEPVYEHCDETTLLGLMRRRYVEVNDYNRNLVTLLREQEHEGRIKILDEQRAVLGGNALLPASVVVWQPKSLE